MSLHRAGLSLRTGEEIVFRPTPGVEIILAAIPTPPTPLRACARQRCREVLRQMLASPLACPPEAIELIDEPGRPLGVTGHPAIGLSLSHESGLSLVAVNFHGPVGIDLLKEEALAAGEAELTALGRDYLGPDTAAQLVSLPEDARRQAFAHAWTQLEARLKYLGLGLAEWTPAQGEALSACQTWAVDLPAGYIGAVAIQPQSMLAVPGRPRN